MVGAYKLDEYQVAQIRNLFENTKLNNQQIATMYGVSRPHISLIRSGKRWNPKERSYVSKKELEMEIKNEPVKIVEKIYVAVEKEYSVWELIRKLLAKLF